MRMKASGACVVLIVLVGAGYVLAQEPATPTSELEQAVKITATGKFVSYTPADASTKSPGVLVLMVGAKKVKYTVSAAVRLADGIRLIDLSDLKVDEKVKVKYTSGKKSGLIVFAAERPLSGP